VAGINLEPMGGTGTGTTQIAPGDLVEITIVSGDGDERARPLPARVSNEGNVMVPLVGAVAVSGLEPMAAEQRIATAAIDRGIYRQPHVTLTITEPAVNRITVLGAVKKPGVVELPRGSSDLASALAAAGGLSNQAGTKVEVLRRGSPSFLAGQPAGQSASNPDGVRLASYTPAANPAGLPFGAPAPFQVDGQRLATSTAWQPPPAGVTRIDLAQAAPMASPENRKLEDCDVVMVLEKDTNTIHVTGLVRKPAQFEFERDEDLRVLDAIAMAGGTTTPVANKVYVIRQLPNMREPVVIKLSISGAKLNGNENLLLAAGDLVSVESTPATMLVDTVSRFMRMSLGLSGRVLSF
jgi:polysaccharide export outer membrane protein